MQTKNTNTREACNLPRAAQGHWYRAAIAGLSLAAVAGTVHATAQAQFTPSFTEVAVGDVFQLVLQGMGFDQSVDGKTIGNVTGGQNLNFSFDSARLEVIGVTIDPRWTFTSGNRAGTINQAAGTVTGTAFGVFPATTDDAFNIATISLRALAPGQASVTLVSAKFIGQTNGSPGQLISTNLGQTTVSVVPEPGQWALLLVGIGALGFRMRKT